MTRLLVVEDDQALRRALAITLRARHYEVDTVGDGAAALRAAAATAYDLVVMDLGLPDLDGVEVIQGIRGWSAVPVIVLSAREAQWQKVDALDAGADDYVTKPFSIPELLARMRAALRHRVQEQGGQPRVQAGELTIDLVHRRVVRGGEEIRLSPKEWDILELLAIHAGRVVTHGQILRKVWGRASETEQQYLRVYMRQLRQKLEPEPNRPTHLVTEAGVGYRLLGEP